MTKRIAIVGASKGIGFALASRLSLSGHSVIALNRTEGEAGPLTGVEYTNYDALSGDPPEVTGSLDALVYCPGSINLKPFHRLSDQDFLDDLNINLLGAVRVIRALLPNLKEAKDPSVVLFSTVAVQTGMGFHSSIAAAKGAVEGLTRSLASEFAPKIRVNCVAPSLTDTPLAERLLNTPEKREASALRHPLKRVGSADEVASVAEFLISEDSGWMTGQILHIDGGMSSIR
jgi:3-oxoacyl-[acyl-carrier protein] reductase